LSISVVVCWGRVISLTSAKSKYFLSVLFILLDVPPSNIFNFDDTNFTNDPKKKTVNALLYGLSFTQSLPILHLRFDYNDSSSKNTQNKIKHACMFVFKFSINLCNLGDRGAWYASG